MNATNTSSSLGAAHFRDGGKLTLGRLNVGTGHAKGEIKILFFLSTNAICCLKGAKQI